MRRWISKIANSSTAELIERGRQGVHVLAERARISEQLQLQSDAQILGQFGGGSDPSDMLAYFRGRDGCRFYASFEDPAATVNELELKFPEHVREVISHANQICDGVFDLLGYKNVRFGSPAPAWHFDPLSGKTSPMLHWSRIGELDPSRTGDKKVIWELNRHQYFTTLGQAYWLTTDEKYADTFVQHVRDWCEKNPPKMGVNWLSSLEIAFRSISWLWAIHFFKNSPSLSGELLAEIVANLHLNGKHLETYLSTYFSPNTHLTGEALGLYLLGSFMPEFAEAGRWRDLGYRILIDTLDIHVMSDGVYCEQSSHYHRYTTDFYLNLLILRRANAEADEPKHVAKLELLLDHLVHLTRPDGTTSLSGDEDGGRFLSLDFTQVDDFRPTLALGATLLERGDLKFVAGEPTPELLWLLGPRGVRKFESIESTVPPKTVQAFPAGGVFCARSSWSDDADHIVINCGPHGFLNGGHAHADALNVILTVGGRPLLVDSGTYCYTTDLAARNCFRSSSAHNCLTVDGISSAVPAGPFSWESTATGLVAEWNESDDEVFFRGSHDGFGFTAMGIKYTREVVFRRKVGTKITERISSADVHSFQLTFILAPGLSAESDRDSVVIREGDRTIAILEGSYTGNLADAPVWRIEDWKVSRKYGALLPTKRICLVFSGSGDISITNVVKETA